MKTILITTEFKRLDFKRMPQYVKVFIDNPDVSTVHPEVGSKIAYKRFNTEAYPRLVFVEEKDLEGNIVYVIRKYFEDHISYSSFRKLDEDTQLKLCKYSPLDLDDINKEFSKFVVERPKEPLPVDMRDFEKQRDFSNTATTYIFEMEEWCKHLTNKELEDDKKDIYEAIIRIVIEKEYLHDNSGWYTMSFANNKEIVYRVHEYDTHVYYFLFDIGSCVDYDALKKKYIKLSDDRLLKQARKGYPDWILYGNFEDWKRLENDDEANLALSDEEIKVLNETRYPYFVNGLAGSGKSTILYYLFAHAYSYKDIKSLDLLFLSYSPKLVKKAKSVIKSLLKTNPSYHGFKFTEDEEMAVDKCFWPFQDFLINTFVTAENEICRFKVSNHLSYDQFQRDYKLSCKLNEANNYSAAIVWSIIRTFIKGRDYKSTFSIESYNNLHKNDKTINSEDFRNIYRIWKNWYKPTYEGKMWDDLDLVAFVSKKMDTGIEFKKYDIIYCDEAQDFTPIENALILKLSKYTDYDLKGFQEIPIAYAGDPNQTVNPTGFNWKRLKEFVDNTFGSMAGNHIKLKDKTLNNNYRSKRTIVEFANSIQYIRKCFLSDERLAPQEQWNPQANPLPGFFFLTTDGTREDDVLTIKAGFAKAECIITGAEGEYERQLDRDELTDDSTTLDDELLASVDNKTKLYTAISSKGLEFKAVLLYRFADQLPKSFYKILNKEEIFNESDKYELAHFFTKLYIAVSRAKEVLYIADTQENFEGFWKHFIDNTFVNSLLDGKQEYNTWHDKVGGIEIGRKAEFLSRMTENFSPLETARKIYEDARLSCNAKDMNRAAGYFEEGGDSTMAEECKAYVLLYENEFQKSGQKFLSMGKLKEATEAFWQGECWDELVRESDRTIYSLTASFMTDKVSLEDYIKNEKVTEYFSYKDDTWKQVAIYIGLKAKDIDVSHIFDVCEFMETLVKRGFVNLNPTIADLYFKNKHYKEAIAKWDDLAKQQHDNRYCENKSYYEAKELTSPTTSEKVFWMNKSGKSDEILKNYSSPRDAELFELDDRAKKIIFTHLLRPHTFSRALEYPYYSEDKYNLLYKADRFQFIEQYVLSDFDESKFDKWISSPIQFEESDIFDKEIPVSVFEKIFMLPKMDNWILFMKQKDNAGYRVMKNAININRIADAISTSLSKKNYMSLASCFLDVVFNNSHYNYANAHKHIETILMIFRKNEFSTRDFIAITKRNKYFDSAEISGHELDFIKDRLRSFVSTKISSYKKIKPSDINDIITLCKIYEKVAPQIQDTDGRYVYDVQSVLDFYNSIKKLNSTKNTSIHTDIIEFIEIRKAVISLQHKKIFGLEYFEELLPKNISIADVTTTFDREDSVWFVGYIYGEDKPDAKAIDKYGMSVAKLIYDFNIIISDYNVKKTKNALKNNLSEFAKNNIENILAQDKINEYSLKLCAYLYEVSLESNTEKAKKYDELSKSARLEKLYRLVSYLQERSLHFYSYLDDKQYEEASRNYDVAISKQTAKEKNRPIIDERGNDRINIGIPYEPKTKDNTSTTTENDSKSTKKRRNTGGSTQMNLFDAAKMAQLEMARNLKKMGIPVDTIRQAAPQLTEAEIDNL